MGIHKSLSKGKAAKGAPSARKPVKAKAAPPQSKLHKAMASAKVARPAAANRDILTKLRAKPAVSAKPSSGATSANALRKPAVPPARTAGPGIPSPARPETLSRPIALSSASGLKASDVIVGPALRVAGGAPLPNPALLRPNSKPLDKKVASMPSSAAKALKTDKPELKPELKKKLDFRSQDWVVYPAHGVGRIVSIEENEVAGMKLELFVINFEKDKMTLRVPVAKAKAVGMRRLSSPDVVQNALATLKGRARIKRTMWSRRAQEYEQKIHSGDLISIAEVVRDLHRASGQPEQSYSERQLYEAAIARLVREVAAVEKIDEDAAMKRLETALLKAAA